MSELDEVIARLKEDGITNLVIKDDPDCVTVVMSHEKWASLQRDLRTVLSAARRVQAMEDTVGFANEVREHVAESGILNARFIEQQYPLLLDLAADRDAARARVRELEAELSRAVRALHGHGHEQEASTFYRFLPEVAP